MKKELTRKNFKKNADIYKLMANPKRLEILNTVRDRELSVEDLTKTLGVRKANVSQHLALLRQAQLVRSRREGIRIFYRITDPRIVEPCRILAKLPKH